MCVCYVAMLSKIASLFPFVVDSEGLSFSFIITIIFSSLVSILRMNPMVLKPAAAPGLVLVPNRRY